MLISVHGPITPVIRIDVDNPLSEICGTWGCLTMWVDENGANIDRCSDKEDGTDDNINPHVSKEEFLAEFIETLTSKNIINVSVLSAGEVPPSGSTI